MRPTAGFRRNGIKRDRMFTKSTISAWIIRKIRIMNPYSSRIFRNLYKAFIRVASISRLRKKTPGDMDIQIHPADHCNLCCKSCSAFSSLVEDCPADTEDIKRDLARLSKLAGGIIGSLTISGGEPLLHPQLPEIIEYARICFPKSKLKIITNGILLEEVSEKFWFSCKNNDVIISLTHYPIKINIENIVKLAEMHCVKLVFQDDTDIREKTMHFDPLDPSGKQNASESYKLCYMANRCFVLENGKLFTCPTIAHIGHFNRFFNQNLKVSDRDYVDIYKAECINEALTFFSKPMPFCRYCNKQDRVFGLAWEISKRELSEWM